MTEPGSEVTLTILRDGKEQQIKVKLAELSAEAAPPEREEGGSRPKAAARNFGDAADTGYRSPAWPARSCLRACRREVDPSGPAAEAGLQPGDVIVEANRQPVRSTPIYRRRLVRADRPCC